MTTNFLCCVECLINKTITCEYCLDYNEYEHKIKRMDKIIMFERKNKSDNFLLLQINTFDLKNCTIDLIGFNKNLKIIKIIGMGDESFDFYRYNLHYNQKQYKINIYQIPKKLEKLICKNVNIYELKNLPDSLEELICTGTKLSEFENLPSRLKYIDCSYNHITNLDNLPNLIKYLNCSNNDITYLDYLNNNLEYLDCSHNKLTNLDNLPNSIKYLFTIGNNICSMLYLPNCLIKLNSATYSNSQSRDKCIKLLQKFNYTIAYK
jgi:Leucine-rich repeat (LRR) protein